MAVGRNDPCPCGSGKKYKRCCAAPRSAQTPPRYVRHEKRECGSCTACCDGWLHITIDGQAIYPGHPCPHSTDRSCRIYEQRPVDPCRHFVCGWLESSSPFPDEFRPDRLKVIVLRARWRQQKVYALVPAGRDPDPSLIEWMIEFSKANAIPILYQVSGEWRGYGPPEMHRDLHAKEARGEPLWSGTDCDITPTEAV